MAAIRESGRGCDLIRGSRSSSKLTGCCRIQFLETVGLRPSCPRTCSPFPAPWLSPQAVCLLKTNRRVSLLLWIFLFFSLTLDSLKGLTWLNEDNAPSPLPYNVTWKWNSVIFIIPAYAPEDMSTREQESRGYLRILLSLVAYSRYSFTLYMLKYYEKRIVFTVILPVWKRKINYLHWLLCRKWVGLAEYYWGLTCWVV